MEYEIKMIETKTEKLDIIMQTNSYLKKKTWEDYAHTVAVKSCPRLRNTVYYYTVMVSIGRKDGI